MFFEANNDHFIGGRLPLVKVGNDEIKFDLTLQLNDLSTDSGSINLMIEWTFEVFFIAL